MLDRQVGLLPGQVGGHAHLLQPRLAALPAEMDEIFSGRADHVRHALDQVALAVAVVVDGVRHVFRRHHLGLAELARPGADHFLGAQVAALDQAQRVEQMAAEHLRAAAVVGERRQRLDRLVLALAAAEIALESPERGDHRRRHAEFLFLAREQRLVLLDLGGAVREPSAGQHLVGDLQEVLGEEALPAVDIDDALIEHQIGRGGGDRGLAKCPGPRLLLEGGEPRLEGCRCCGSSPGRMPSPEQPPAAPPVVPPVRRIAWFVMYRPRRVSGQPARLVSPCFGDGASCSWNGNSPILWWGPLGGDPAIR